METEKRVLTPSLVMAVIASTLLAFTGTVVETSMNVAFPNLMAEFGVSTSEVSWITTGYLLVVAILIPASSYFTQRFTLKQQFAAASLIFITGTVMCAASPSFTVLLAGRIIEGVGTGIAIPLTINIIMTQAPKECQGTMLGVSLLFTSAAPAAGPAIGGAVMSFADWRMIFVVLLPILLFSLVSGLACIKVSRKAEKIPFDIRSFVLLAVCFTTFILALTLSGDWGWADVRIWLLFAVTAATLIGFIVSCKKASHPLIHMSIFKNKAFAFAVLSVFPLAFCNLGCGFTIPNYAQIVWNESVFTAGLLMIPGVLLGAVMSPVYGRLFDKKGAKIPVALTHIFLISGAVFMAIMINFAGVIVFVAGFIIFGAGTGGFSSIITNGIQLLPEERGPDGNAVINTFIQLSAAVGTAVVTTVITISQNACGDIRQGMISGTGINLVIIICAELLAAFGSVMMFRSRKKHAS